MTSLIGAIEAQKILAAGEGILIDVREPEEFQNEHIAYALSLPLSHFDESLAQMHIAPDKKIIMQCFKGARGEQACMHMQTASSCKNRLYNMEGGISAWKQAGLPVIGKTAPPISIFRQVQMIAGSLIVLLIFIGFFSTSAGFIGAGMIGAALFFSGLSGWCGMALLLAGMPWNKR